MAKYTVSDPVDPIRWMEEHNETIEEAASHFGLTVVEFKRLLMQAGYDPGKAKVLVQVGDVLKPTPAWVHAEESSDPSDPLAVSDKYGLSYNAASEVAPYHEWDHYDPARINARFVVVEARGSGFVPGSTPGSGYPDNWHVLARRLKPDGSYDPKGETVEFYQTGSYLCMSFPEVVGKMQQTFVPITEESHG